MALNEKLASLRTMLWQMEVEVGLEQLSSHQKDVYYAACLTADEDQFVHSEAVKHHAILSKMSRPTFYRSLRELVEQGFLTAAGSGRDGLYMVKR